MAEEQNGEPTGVGAVQRAMAILSSFTLDNPERGITEISQEVGLPKATVHRLLAALAGARFVDQDPATGKYRLGVALLGLGAVAASRLNYREKALPHLRIMVQEVEETAIVATLEGKSHLCTLVVEAPRPIRVTTAVGMRRPAYFGSAGRVLLAWQPEEVLDRLLPADRLESFTIWSVTDPAEYRRQLRTVREQGFALERGEGFPDVAALGAPIFDHTGKVVAAVSLAAPTHRVPDERIPGLIQRLLQTTQAISAELGYSTVQIPVVAPVSARA